MSVDDSLMPFGAPWRLMPWMVPAVVVVGLMLSGFDVVLRPRLHALAPERTIEVRLVKLTPAVAAPIGPGPVAAATISLKPPSSPPLKKERIKHRPEPPKIARSKRPVPIAQPSAAAAARRAPGPVVVSLSSISAPAVPGPPNINPGTGMTDARETSGGGSSAPIFDADYLHNPPPSYPVVALRMGIEGEVLLRVLVSPQGEPVKIELGRSSGSSILDDAAKKAVEHWRFIPARRGGEPVESWVEVPIRFRLMRID